MRALLFVMFFVYAYGKKTKKAQESSVVEKLVKEYKKRSKTLSISKSKISLVKKQIYMQIADNLLTATAEKHLVKKGGVKMQGVEIPDSTYSAGIRAAISSEMLKAAINSPNEKDKMKIEILSNAEKAIKEYLISCIAYKVSNEQFKRAKQFLKQREIDLKEAEAKEKIGTIDEVELVQMRLSLKESEISFAALAESNEANKQKLLSFLEKTDDMEEFFSILDFEKIEEDIEVFVSNEVKNNHSSSVKQIQAKVKSLIVDRNLSWIPPIELSSSLNKSGANLSDIYNEIKTTGISVDSFKKNGKASLSFKISNVFFDTYKATKEAEYAKFESAKAIKQSKIQSEVKRNILKILKEEIKMLKELVKLRKISLDQVEEFYEKGLVDYQKLYQAREQVQSAYEKYYQKYSSFLNEYVENLLINGKLEEMV